MLVCVVCVIGDTAFSPCLVVYEVLFVVIIAVFGWIRNCCTAMT